MSVRMSNPLRRSGCLGVSSMLLESPPGDGRHPLATNRRGSDSARPGLPILSRPVRYAESPLATAGRMEESPPGTVGTVDPRAQRSSRPPSFIGQIRAGQVTTGDLLIWPVPPFPPCLGNIWKCQNLCVSLPPKEVRSKFTFRVTKRSVTGSRSANLKLALPP